jgi:hypothetical protein
LVKERDLDSRFIHAAASRKLAKLLEPASSAGDAPTIYHGADRAVILRHQLAAPLGEELSSPICGAAGRADPLVNLDPSLKTFADLLHHESPPLDLLKRTKEFAKSCRADPDLLPPEVATLLYYAAIVVARLRHDQRITELDDEKLRKGVEWAIEQAWLDQPTRTLFREGLERLS